MFHLLKSATILISSPTNSGKIYFVSKFVKNVDYLMSPPSERIVWCYSIWQKAYDQIKADFIQGIPDFDYFDHRSTLLIIDNLMGEQNNTVTKFFTRGSHHMNIMVVYLVQNLFFRGIRTISLNSQIVILFKNPRDSGQLSLFAKHTKKIKKIFSAVTRHSYGYLLFDFCSETLDQLRICTGIFPEDKQFVYVLT